MTTAPPPIVLDDKVRRFADEYLVDLDATAAYARAGFKPAKQNAHRMLNRPEVQGYIRAAMAARADRMHLTQQKVIAGLLAELDKTDAKAADRIRVWELLGRHLGMWKLTEETVRVDQVNFVIVAPPESKDVQQWAERHAPRITRQP